ncbi:MAG: FGGY-family carbohydrate kinase [Candidatus Omnitrophica bacterium]|nr:FGGY-family carbohydrate kinase [Candidatus Omnitrophota bacterium]
MMQEAVIGLDLGTGGARAVAVTSEGKILSSASHITAPPFMDASGRSEQLAQAWQACAVAAMEKCVEGFTEPVHVHAVCVDATSGTVVFLDAENKPLYPGLMHNDSRSGEEAAYLNDFLSAHCREVGSNFGATFSLAKILWMKRHEPKTFEKTQRICHQSDYILGELTGEYGVSDPSNSLKSGFNIVRDSWPREFSDLGIQHLMPEVKASGTLVGTLKPSLSKKIGLNHGIEVLSGVTDSTAAFLASGAHEQGDFCNTLGTTLAYKGISSELVHDPEGVVYCHRHPGGGWLPGGASNVGGACLRVFFPDRNLVELDRHAALRFPSRDLSYPLVETGERFPFKNDRAQGFIPMHLHEEELHLSLLQGVALVERWGLERFSKLGMPTCSRIYATGSGSKSDVWCQIRSNVLQLPLIRPSSTDSAFGVAVLAGSKVFYDGDLAKATQGMTRVDREFAPHTEFSNWASEMLEALKRECYEKGLLS